MLRVRLLGDLTVELDGSAVELPASRRARSLLGLLALERRMHHRSVLAARFWPEVLDESARTSLRSALSALRRALGPESERYLVANRDEIGLAGEERVWTDVMEFDRLSANDLFEEALALCRGDLLSGLDDDWVYDRRDEHRDRVAAVLARLAARAESDQDLKAAIGFTRRQATLDPLAEAPQRDLMRRLAAGGDRAAAIRTYERFSRRLRDELRIMPSQATRELAESLRQVPAATEPRPAPGVMSPVVSVPAPAIEEAGAVVTLLFTDLVGSTELLGQLGDDEAERLRRLHFGSLRDVATAHSGHEVKNLGDGLMVVFPSAVNAVSCAIGIQQAVHRHNARHGDDRLRVRVGLNVGEPIHDEGDYFGTPVVVAKRLCDAAQGGQILASDLLRELIGSRGGFDFRPCGSLALKGISDAVAASEVVWEPASARRIPPPPSFVSDEPAALVGRAAPLEELGRYWRDARNGRRRIAMLTGEPGIGKTRLAAEFCRAAYADGATVLLGRCYEESLVPYQPFVEALSHYVAESPLGAVRLQVGPHRATLARLLPQLAAKPPEPATRSSAEDPERAQFLLFDAVASFLREVADAYPLILVLDDLHWADAPTLLLLRHIARGTEETPLLILGTYRVTEVDQAHPLAQALAELRRARALDRLTIGGLGEEDVAQLISARVGREAPAAFARSIVERTQGNPLFVEEVLRDVGADDDWSAADARIGIPETVKDLLLRRLQRLDDNCGRLLTFAAVTGREFGLDVLERVSDMSADRIAENLEQAIAARVIEESAGVIGRYSFTHALIRETIYDQLSHTRRAQLHRLIGAAIEDTVADASDEHTSALARHFSAAGDVAKAYKFHSRAAAAAQRVYAIEPALLHYTAALEAGGELGLEAESERAIRDLLLQRGRLRYRIGDDAGAAADSEAALDGAQRSGDRVVEMEALNELGILRLRSDLAGAADCHEAALAIAQELEDPAAQTQALDRLSVISSHLLELDRGLHLGERALELARDTGDASVVGRALDSVKLAVLQLGDLRRLDELTDELERLWRERSDLWYLQWTLLESAFVPIGAARWEEAAKRLAEAVAINRRVRDPRAEALILDALCWLHRSRGAYEEALSAGRGAVEVGGSVGWEDWTAPTLGCLLLELCAPEPAAAVLERGLAVAEVNGARHVLTRCLGLLAWTRWLLGAQDEARSLAARAEKLLDLVSAPPGGAFVFGAHAYAAIARVHLAAGVPERGEALLSPLLAAAERSGWREATAITELVLGLCVEARGDPGQATALVGHAAEIADKHDIPGVGWEAHAALARMHRAGARPAAGDGQLAIAEAIVERVTAGLKDGALRDGLRERAKASVRSEASISTRSRASRDLSGPGLQARRDP
jgi:class 3 adenylate cyclase/tetratricopeptide (TPR) repeat protein